MKSAGAEVHHYDVTNDDKLFAEFLKSQMSLGSLNTAAQVHHPELRSCTTPDFDDAVHKKIHFVELIVMILFPD